MDMNTRAAKAATAAASRAITALHTIRDIAGGSTIDLDTDPETIASLVSRVSLELAKIAKAVTS